MFKNKTVTVGISGGIAAYKSAEIVSWLKKNNAGVRVIMTEAACQFITPLTMKTLSGQPVALDLMSMEPGFKAPHLDLAACDLFLVLPATANILAKAAWGLADDLLSASLLATKAQVMAAPAMHCDMYADPATQRNLQILADRGWRLLEPGEGVLACGAIGKGRLAEIPEIMQAIEAALNPDQPWAGRRVLITAGPTWEALDPVRYLGNRSSGKMGYCLAEAARDLGAAVDLLSGPVALKAPPGVNLHRVESALEMAGAAAELYPACNLVIAAAAVADYRPRRAAKEKIKKSSASLCLDLALNPDILADMGQNKGERILIGFAAETENLLAEARKKLKEKNLDYIVANDLSQSGAGFEKDTNIATIISAQGEEKQFPLMSKKDLAREILQFVIHTQ